MIAQLDRTFVRMAPGRAISRVVGYTFFEGRPATTSGRWWNPVVFGNLRLASAMEGRQVDRPVFIIGMGRSGTTLLGRVLAAHPSVGFLNEPKAMWHVIRDDEDIIGSYDSSRGGRLYLDAVDASEEVRNRSKALVAWYLRASRSKRLVDKYPELVFRHSFVREIYSDARFLIAVRSPWSTLKSVAKWSEAHTVDNADWWGVGDQKWDILWKQGIVEHSTNADLASLDLADNRDGRVRAAIEWVVTMREAISCAVSDPLATIVRYEDLICQPREVVRRTLDFCELPGSPRTEAYASSIVSAQGGNEDRHSTTIDLPPALADAIDETWCRVKVVDRGHTKLGAR
jgi:Sulfotransferase family